jgi:hypothetical protein
MLAQNVLNAETPFLLLLEIWHLPVFKVPKQHSKIRLLRLELENLIATIGLSYRTIGQCIGRSIHSLIGERAG